MSENLENIENIRVLCEISTIIQSESDLRDKFQQALEIVRTALDCPSASLFIHDDESGKLEETASVGKRVELIESINFDMGKGFSAWVAKQRRSVLIPNLRKERRDGLKSFISTPLVTGEKLIGVMNLGHEEANAFTEKHMEFLEIIAGQFAHAIERSDYQRMLLEKNAALVEAQEEIKRQQETIIEMEKYHLLGQLAVSINHEINNPLTTILGNVELLLMMNPEMSEMMRKKLDVINTEAQRIAKTVEKLKDAKKVVVGDYIEKSDEKMIDIDLSSKSADSEDEENLS